VGEKEEGGMGEKEEGAREEKGWKGGREGEGGGG
jgi:hypothetical protein